MDPYNRQNNFIPPIRPIASEKFIEIGGEEEEDDDSLVCYEGGNASGLRLPSIRTAGVPYPYNHSSIAVPVGYPNDSQWGDYIPDDHVLLSLDMEYLAKRPLFNDGSSMAIVDSQGNVIQDLNGDRDLSDVWDVPQQSYNPEINRYIDHIRADPTKSLDEIKTLMENIRPDMEIPPEDREGTPMEMTYPLMEHQKLGLTWLKSMEEGSNKGGILADDMGLGKTIQALALLVSRRSTNKARRTTLILTPVALLKQWEREIKVKLKPEHGLKVCIHHGTSKRAKCFADLAKNDGELWQYLKSTSRFPNHC